MNDSKNIQLDDLGRLKWACRRGMLELDLLLVPFLNNAYQTLSKPEKEAFILLLNEADPDIYAWIMGTQAIENDDLALIIKKVRTHAQSTF